MAAQAKAPITILRRPQVEARTGLSRSTIYDFIKRDIFPAPIPLGGRTVGWIEAEVDAWLQAQIEKNRAGAA